MYRPVNYRRRPWHKRAVVEADRMERDVATLFCSWRIQFLFDGIGLDHSWYHRPIGEDQCRRTIYPILSARLKKSFNWRIASLSSRSGASQHEIIPGLESVGGT